MSDNKINVDNLSEDELIDLNHRIVERLKFLESYHTHKEMMKFSPGDKVSFQPAGRDPIIGTLMKFNKKTVTIISEGGRRWNVSPALLVHLKDITASNNNERGNIIELPCNK